jgi:hypothetical protein
MNRKPRYKVRSWRWTSRSPHSEESSANITLGCPSSAKFATESSKAVSFLERAYL